MVLQIMFLNYQRKNIILFKYVGQFFSFFFQHKKRTVQRSFLYVNGGVKDTIDVAPFR